MHKLYKTQDMSWADKIEDYYYYFVCVGKELEAKKISNDKYQLDESEHNFAGFFYRISRLFIQPAFEFKLHYQLCPQCWEKVLTQEELDLTLTLFKVGGIAAVEEYLFNSYERLLD